MHGKGLGLGEGGIDRAARGDAVQEREFCQREKKMLISGVHLSAKRKRRLVPIRYLPRVGRGPVQRLGRKAPRGLFPFFCSFFSFFVLSFIL
jgi:hypothetical protein